MTQDQTRTFLAQCDPKALFSFYAKGTLVEDMQVRCSLERFVLPLLLCVLFCTSRARSSDDYGVDISVRGSGVWDAPPAPAAPDLEPKSTSAFNRHETLRPFLLTRRTACSR